MEKLIIISLVLIVISSIAGYYAYEYFRPIWRKVQLTDFNRQQLNQRPLAAEKYHYVACEAINYCLASYSNGPLSKTIGNVKGLSKVDSCSIVNNEGVVENAYKVDVKYILPLTTMLEEEDLVNEEKLYLHSLKSNFAFSTIFKAAVLQTFGYPIIIDVKNFHIKYKNGILTLSVIML